MNFVGLGHQTRIHINVYNNLGLRSPLDSCVNTNFTETNDGPTGLVSSIGRHFVCRIIRQGGEMIELAQDLAVDLEPHDEENLITRLTSRVALAVCSVRGCQTATNLHGCKFTTVQQRLLRYSMLVSLKKQTRNIPSTLYRLYGIIHNQEVFHQIERQGYAQVKYIKKE